MTSVYFQIEFYSHLEQRWVPLFAKENTEADAWRRADQLLVTDQRRVVKVTQTTEVMERQ